MKEETKEKVPMQLISIANIINFVVILMSVVGFVIAFVKDTEYWTWVFLFFVAFINLIPDNITKSQKEVTK